MYGAVFVWHIAGKAIMLIAQDCQLYGNSIERMLEVTFTSYSHRKEHVQSYPRFILAAHISEAPNVWAGFIYPFYDWF